MELIAGCTPVVLEPLVPFGGFFFQLPPHFHPPVCSKLVVLRGAEGESPHSRAEGDPQGRAELSEVPPVTAEGGPAPGWAEGFPQGTWRALEGHPQGHTENR